MRPAMDIANEYEYQASPKRKQTKLQRDRKSLTASRLKNNGIRPVRNASHLSIRSLALITAYGYRQAPQERAGVKQVRGPQYAQFMQLHNDSNNVFVSTMIKHLRLQRSQLLNELISCATAFTLLKNITQDDFRRTQAQIAQIAELFNGLDNNLNEVASRVRKFQPSPGETYNSTDVARSAFSYRNPQSSMDYFSKVENACQILFRYLENRNNKLGKKQREDENELSESKGSGSKNIYTVNSAVINTQTGISPTTGRQCLTALAEIFHGVLMLNKLELRFKGRVEQSEAQFSLIERAIENYRKWTQKILRTEKGAYSAEELFRNLMKIIKEANLEHEKAEALDHPILNKAIKRYLAIRTKVLRVQIQEIYNAIWVLIRQLPTPNYHNDPYAPTLSLVALAAQLYELIDETNSKKLKGLHRIVSVRVEELKDREKQVSHSLDTHHRDALSWLKILSESQKAVRMTKEQIRADTKSFAISHQLNYPQDLPAIEFSALEGLGSTFQDGIKLAKGQTFLHQLDENLGLVQFQQTVVKAHNEFTKTLPKLTALSEVVHKAVDELKNGFQKLITAIESNPEMRQLIYEVKDYQAILSGRQSHSQSPSQERLCRNVALYLMFSDLDLSFIQQFSSQKSITYEKRRTVSIRQLYDQMSLVKKLAHQYKINKAVSICSQLQWSWQCCTDYHNYESSQSSGQLHPSCETLFRWLEDVLNLRLKRSQSGSVLEEIKSSSRRYEHCIEDVLGRHKSDSFFCQELLGVKKYISAIKRASPEEVANYISALLRLWKVPHGGLVAKDGAVVHAFKQNDEASAIGYINCFTMGRIEQPVISLVKTTVNEPKFVQEKKVLEAQTQKQSVKDQSKPQSQFKSQHQSQSKSKGQTDDGIVDDYNSGGYEQDFASQEINMQEDIQEAADEEIQQAQQKIKEIALEQVQDQPDQNIEEEAIDDDIQDDIQDDIEDSVTNQVLDSYQSKKPADSPSPSGKLKRPQTAHKSRQSVPISQNRPPSAMRINRQPIVYYICPWMSKTSDLTPIYTLLIKPPPKFDLSIDQLNDFCKVFSLASPLTQVGSIQEMITRMVTKFDKEHANQFSIPLVRTKRHLGLLELCNQLKQLQIDQSKQVKAVQQLRDKASNSSSGKDGALKETRPDKSAPYELLSRMQSYLIDCYGVRSVEKLRWRPQSPIMIYRVKAGQKEQLLVPVKMTQTPLDLSEQFRVPNGILLELFQKIHRKESFQRSIAVIWSAIDEPYRQHQQGIMGYVTKDAYKQEQVKLELQTMFKQVIAAPLSKSKLYDSLKGISCKKRESSNRLGQQQAKSKNKNGSSTNVTNNDPSKMDKNINSNRLSELLCSIVVSNSNAPLYCLKLVNGYSKTSRIVIVSNDKKDITTFRKQFLQNVPMNEISNINTNNNNNIIRSSISHRLQQLEIGPLGQYGWIDSYDEPLLGNYVYQGGSQIVEPPPLPPIKSLEGIRTQVGKDIITTINDYILRIRHYNDSQVSNTNNSSTINNNNNNTPNYSLSHAYSSCIVQYYVYQPFYRLMGMSQQLQLLLHSKQVQTHIQSIIQQDNSLRNNMNGKSSNGHTNSQTDNINQRRKYAVDLLTKIDKFNVQYTPIVNNQSTLMGVIAQNGNGTHKVGEQIVDNVIKALKITEVNRREVIDCLSYQQTKFDGMTNINSNSNNQNDKKKKNTNKANDTNNPNNNQTPSLTKNCLKLNPLHVTLALSQTIPKYCLQKYIVIANSSANTNPIQISDSNKIIIPIQTVQDSLTITVKGVHQEVYSQRTNQMVDVKQNQQPFAPSISSDIAWQLTNNGSQSTSSQNNKTNNSIPQIKYNYYSNIQIQAINIQLKRIIRHLQLIQYYQKSYVQQVQEQKAIKAKRERLKKEEQEKLKKEEQERLRKEEQERLRKKKEEEERTRHQEERLKKLKKDEQQLNRKRQEQQSSNLIDSIMVSQYLQKISNDISGLNSNTNNNSQQNPSNKTIVVGLTVNEYLQGMAQNLQSKENHNYTQSNCTNGNGNPTVISNSKNPTVNNNRNNNSIPPKNYTINQPQLAVAPLPPPPIHPSFQVLPSDIQAQVHIIRKYRCTTKDHYRNRIIKIGPIQSDINSLKIKGVVMDGNSNGVIRNSNNNSNTLKNSHTNNNIVEQFEMGTMSEGWQPLTIDVVKEQQKYRIPTNCTNSNDREKYWEQTMSQGYLPAE